MIDFLTKYAPNTHTDLIVPTAYKSIVEMMFTGKLPLCSKGFVLYGQYGLGKSELITLLKRNTKWSHFTIPDKATANGSTIADIRTKFYAVQDDYNGIYATDYKVEPPRFIIECNEISQATSAFLNSLTHPIDEFYNYSKEKAKAGTPHVPALWLFTDNFPAKLETSAEGVFSDSRIKLLDWGNITLQQTAEYAYCVLKQEGLDSVENRKVLKTITDEYGKSIRDILTQMGYNIGI